MSSRVSLLRFLSIAAAVVTIPLLLKAAEPPDLSNQWKIRSIRVCRDHRGTVIPHLDVVGSYPVYSFFVPRPVWTVNGTVVDSRPVYTSGQLTAFTLIGGVGLLKSLTKNNIKFSLPDQHAAKVFHFDERRVPTGDCFDFF
ncbi:MAG: hypothetical protein AB1646_04850 [Thermodesulfobacteriota bacterium]